MRKLATIFAFTSVMGVGVVFSQSAMAVGGNCTATKGTIARTGPDNYYVIARCSSLQSDSRARGILGVSGPDFDQTTSWFTTLNRNYNSGSNPCFFGCSVRTEIASL